MGRRTLPRSAGDLRRKENLRYMIHLVRMKGSSGITRADLVPLYAYQTGLTEKKAEEHLDLLISVRELEEDDLRIYVTGIRSEQTK